MIFTYMRSFRHLIRTLIREMNEGEEKDEKLLTEPDDVPDRDEDTEEAADASVPGCPGVPKEASAVASIAGVTTPLGTGPTYPGASKKRKKKKLPKGWQKSS